MKMFELDFRANMITRKEGPVDDRHPIAMNIEISRERIFTFRVKIIYSRENRIWIGIIKK